MPVKGTLEFKALSNWLEELAAAEKDVDAVVGELLAENQPFIKEELERNLHKTSEQWTPELALTIDVREVKREGNFIFIEASAGEGDEQAAQAKEYGTTRQAAEPFFRPTFRGHLLKNRLKATMKTLLEKYGLSTS